MKTAVLALVLMTTGSAAFAAEHDRHAMHMSTPKKGSAASTVALQKANMTMHKDMDITYTGDADIDFLRGMIAHHQGAIDMAEVQLKYGRDTRIKRMSQEIIRNQNLEIKWMKLWLAELEKQPHHANTAPQTHHWSDAAWDGDSWLGER